MTDNVTVIRYNDRLQQTDDKLRELTERYDRISINDSNLWATHGFAARAATAKHARSRARDHAGALEPQRIARRALQTGLSGS